MGEAWRWFPRRAQPLDWAGGQCFPALVFAEPHASTTAILGDELDASGFEGGADGCDGAILQHFPAFKF